MKLSRLATTTASNWSDLQCELLELILKRLSFVDTIRFKAVCWSWNKAAGSYISSSLYTQLPQIPWLMVENDRPDKHYDCRFINLAENAKNGGRVYKVKNVLKGFYKGYVEGLGSSYGWVAVLNSLMEPALVNPFTGAQILIEVDFLMNYICKIVLSSDPSVNMDFSLAGLYGRRQSLAFYKHKDKQWTWRSQYCYLDIISHNCHIYGLSKTYTVDVWDFHSNLLIKVVDTAELELVTNQSVVRRNLVPNSEIMWKYYLVESLGEVLIVKQMVLCTSARPFDTERTVGFIVCRLDLESEEGFVTLQSLSDRALLIGDKEATSMSTRDFPELQENSVYFKDDTLGIYNLKEEKFSTIGYPDELNHMRLACWIVPNP